jgi:hypothetical protein
VAARVRRPSVAADGGGRTESERVAYKLAEGGRGLVMESRKRMNRTTRVDLWRKMILAAIACGIVVMLPVVSRAQQSGEKAYASPGDAVLALYDAAKTDNGQAMDVIFGKNANAILHTGDEVADKNMVANFVKRYDQMRRVVIEPDGSVTLYIGAENWPLPIPIVKNSSGQWYFDTEAGMKEILYRRIGRNENDAIDTLHTLVDAQHNYASEGHDGARAGAYAMRFISASGKQDGLYWKTDDNQPPSPIGPQIADASSEGYNIQQGKETPFHGYYFRILTKQGPAAKGGARNYVVNGRLTKGFGFVAYPAKYRNSGVMTFIANQDGVVYEKDLGADTGKIGAGTAEFNPDKTWSNAD